MAGGLIFSVRCPLCGHVSSLTSMAQRLEAVGSDQSLVHVQQSGGRGKLTKAHRYTRQEALAGNIPRSSRALLELVFQSLDGALARLAGSGSLGDLLQHAAHAAAHSTMVDMAKGQAAAVPGSYVAIAAGPVPYAHPPASPPRPYGPSAGTFETVTANEAAARRR